MNEGTNVQVNKKKTFHKTINTKFTKDATLSLRAKGLMIYLLSMPDNWKGQLYQITTGSSDTPYGVKTAMKELVEKGYAMRKWNDKVDGQFQGSYYIISDTREFSNETS